MVGLTSNAFDDMDLSAEKRELLFLKEIHALKSEGTSSAPPPEDASDQMLDELRQLRMGEPNKKMTKVVSAEMRPTKIFRSAPERGSS